MSPEYTLYVPPGQAARLETFVAGSPGSRILTKTPLKEERKVWSDVHLRRIALANQAIEVLELHKNKEWEGLALEGYRKFLTDTFFNQTFSQLPSLQELNEIFGTEVLGLYRDIEPSGQTRQGAADIPTWYPPALSPTKVVIITGSRALSQPYEIGKTELAAILSIRKKDVKQYYDQAHFAIQSLTSRGYYPRLGVLVQNNQ